MTDRPMAKIVTYCIHCSGLMGFHTDLAGESVAWAEPKVGNKVELDLMAQVDGPFPGPGMNLYIVGLDTSRRPTPHCAQARPTT